MGKIKRFIKEIVDFIRYLIHSIFVDIIWAILWGAVRGIARFIKELF